MTSLSRKLSLPLIIVTAFILFLTLSPNKASAGTFGFFNFFNTPECPCNFAKALFKTKFRGKSIGADVNFNFFCDEDEEDGFFGIAAFTQDCAVPHAAYTDRTGGGCEPGTDFCCITGGVCGNVQREDCDQCGASTLPAGFIDLRQIPLTEAEYDACVSEIQAKQEQLCNG